MKKILATLVFSVVFAIMPAVAEAEAPTLLGSNVTKWPQTVPYAPGYGMVSAWEFSGQNSGTSSTFSIYLQEHNAQEEVGIYSDNSGLPGSLLGYAYAGTSGTGWRLVSLSGVSISTGTNYWLAFVQTGSGSNSVPMDANALPDGACADSSPPYAVPDKELFSTYSSLPSTWPAGDTGNYGLCSPGMVVK